MIDFKGLAAELTGLSARDAEARLEGSEGEVRVLRPVAAGAVRALGPFRANRINLHVDEGDIVRDVSQG